MGVQGFVQLDGRLVGLALHGAGQRVATEQQIRLASQVARLDHLDQGVTLVEQVHLGAGGDVQAGFDGVAVAQRDADTGVGADQAAFTDADDDVAAAGQSAHGRAAAAQVRALADEDASGNAAFDHARAFGAAVEVDEAFVHHGGAFADIGAQAHTGAVGDTHAGRHHVVGHFRELVHREHFQQLALQACFQLAFGQLAEVDGALTGPGHVGQQRENAGQAQAVRLDQTMRQQVQLEVGLRGAGQRGVFSQEGGDQRVVAFGQTGQQRRLSGVHAFQGFGQVSGLCGGEGDGLVAALVAELLGGLGYQLAGRIEQRQGVEDFQPVALAVLGANTKGDAVKGGAH